MATTAPLENEIIIREYYYGVGIFGLVPIPLVVALAAHYRDEKGFDVFDSQSAETLGATLVITANKEIWNMRNEADGHQ